MERLKTITLILILNSISTISFADSDKEAEKLLSAPGMDDAYKDIVTEMVDLKVRDGSLPKEYKGIMLEFFFKYVSLESLKPEMISVLTENFTEPELKELNAFSKTRVGEKTIYFIAELMLFGGGVGNSVVRNNAQALETMLQEEAKVLSESSE